MPTDVSNCQINIDKKCSTYIDRYRGDNFLKIKTAVLKLNDETYSHGTGQQKAEEAPSGIPHSNTLSFRLINNGTQ